MSAIIGVMPLLDSERESLWMLPGYMDGIIRAGGIPVMLPLTDDEKIIRELADKCDGFLFTGGQDVSPSLYNQPKSEKCGEISDILDTMEGLIFKRVLDADKPLLGICRGIQFINAVLGGTLYQDIPTQINSRNEHHQKPPYNLPSHKVRIIENTPLYNLTGKTEIAVNSYHHQAIKDLADGLSVMAEADDGLIEAVYMPSKKFVWAVQWHPEFSFKTDKDSMKIFKAFISSI